MDAKTVFSPTLFSATFAQDSKPILYYPRTSVDRCVGVAQDVLLGPSMANTREYENGVKDALRLFQTALALTA